MMVKRRVAVLCLLALCLGVGAPSCADMKDAEPCYRFARVYCEKTERDEGECREPTHDACNDIIRETEDAEPWDEGAAGGCAGAGGRGGMGGMSGNGAASGRGGSGGVGGMVSAEGGMGGTSPFGGRGGIGGDAGDSGEGEECAWLYVDPYFEGPYL